MPAEERTEQATSQRKRDERKKGNVPQSKDLIVVGSMIISFYVLKLFGPMMLEQMQSSLYTFVAMAATKATLEQADLMPMLSNGLTVVVICITPMLLASVFTSVIFTMAQTKLLVTKEAFKFKFNKLNPISGFKKIISMRGLVELLKSSIKLAVVFYICYTKYIEYIPKFARLMDMDMMAAVSLIGEFVMSLINSAAVIFLFLAGADYLYQRYEYNKSIRMTKQEIKEEYKHTEGDPKVKAQIRQRQRKQAMGRMMQNVPTADVIIRNPTHYAIAVKYDGEKNRAPIVVAKGADLVAQRIIAIALDHNIATIENRTLARGLFEAVDIDREIPEKFYQPVAEVLAFVYGLRDKAKGNKTKKGK